MKALRWMLLGAGLLLLVSIGALAWLLNSQLGAQWVANRAVAALGGKLSIESVQGHIVGPLHLRGLRYRDPRSGIDARIKHASLNVDFSDLLTGRVHIEPSSAWGVALWLSEPTEKKPPKPFSLEPPIDVLLDRFILGYAQLTRNGQPLLTVRRGILSGAWTDAGIAIRQLDIASSQGTVHLTGQVAQDEAYIGSLAGRFDWRQGELRYAGEINGRAEGRRATLVAQISAPLAAKLDATLEQQAPFPWHLSLHVPRFDPRSNFMPGSSLASLAADLTATGNKSLAEIRGLVALNGEGLRIEPLRVRMQDQIAKIEALTLVDPRGRGRLDAEGEVRLDPEPFVADLAAQWRDVTLPPRLAGQVLATHGKLHLRGNTAVFSADGDFALGPPGRLADFSLALNGTPQQIELRELAVTERRGRLTASGQVQLKPALGWRVEAQAKSFDPGSFVAGWPGKLKFNLRSEGTVAPDGPSATFNLTGLEGTLRQRRVAGHADLALSANKVLAGTMELRSGGSVLRLNGKRASSMNLAVNFDVATLDDWLPSATGRLDGRLLVTGRWPEFSIAGNAHGRKLALAESSADSINVNVDMSNPLHPRGKLSVDASAIHAGGFEFTSLAVQASGSEAEHVVSLVGVGDPLSGELRVTGTRRGASWAGSIEQLKLAATGVTQVALREPARLTAGASGFSLSQSCLVGDSVSVCLAAERDSNGGLQVSYVIEHLPLALVAAVAKPDLPFELTGAIEGRGQVRRSSSGALFGDAHLASPSGGAHEQGDDTLAGLLSYENLRVDATMTGDAVQVTSSGTLGGRGAVQGAAKLTRLQSAAPLVDGKADLTIEDLAPIALFTPQLSDVAGRGEAHVLVSGALKSPKITGTVRAASLAAEIPMVGIKLREGALDAELRDGGNISLTGRVTSGDGQLELNGGTAADGVLHVKASGKNFLAADIPAARVVISPDFQLTRSATQMQLDGTVQVAHAAIDLTKLPEGQAKQHASPDVVVIDDEDVAVERSRGAPLHANITVVLGDDVKLVGFGLDSTLTGQLAVQETPGEPTLGTGEIRVAGTYKAYGQDLTIEQGALLYAASPLDNPQVNLVAVRTLPEITAKLTVTGSARRPLLSVSSDPAVSQTEALSYLVTGKPLNTLGTGEGDVVQSAARSLGGAAGNLLAKNIGKRIGVDEMGIQNNTELGGSAFTVGQYLSPRLYLSYGVGLFEPGQVVNLRYRISNSLSLEASQGPINQRAGLTYKVEK